MKKHNFKISAPVQAFKIQFIDNVMLTKYFSILESKNLNLPKSISLKSNINYTTKNELKRFYDEKSPITELNPNKIFMNHKFVNHNTFDDQICLVSDNRKYSNNELFFKVNKHKPVANYNPFFGGISLDT
jgi:hypothetical protein